MIGIQCKLHPNDTNTMVGATTDPTYLNNCNAHLIVQRMASAPNHCTLLITRKELRKALDSCDATNTALFLADVAVLYILLCMLLYLVMNSSLKCWTFSKSPGTTSSLGRMVVRKWNVLQLGCADRQ